MVAPGARAYSKFRWGMVVGVPVLVAVAIGIFVFVIPVFDVIDRHARETQVRAAEIVIANRPGKRPPVGVPRSGNAFDEYGAVGSP